jgi:hypothetical protein
MAEHEGLGHIPLQAGLAGYLPLVLEEAGSRVAETPRARPKTTVKRVEACIFTEIE